MRTCGRLMDAELIPPLPYQPLKGQWRLNPELFGYRKDGAPSGILNFSSAWFMQGMEVCVEIQYQPVTKNVSWVRVVRMA